MCPCERPWLPLWASAITDDVQTTDFDLFERHGRIRGTVDQHHAVRRVHRVQQPADGLPAACVDSTDPDHGSSFDRETRELVHHCCPVRVFGRGEHGPQA